METAADGSTGNGGGEAANESLPSGVLKVRLVWIVGFGLLGNVGAILLADLFLLFPDKTRRIPLPA